MRAEPAGAKVSWYPRPEILAALPPRGHVVLEASAGTGKTYALEHLVIELLLHGGVEIEEILVVTFTEKATEELRTRLRAKLLELSQRDDLSDGGPPPSEATHWRLDREARDRLRDALVRFDAATISTIHGFCQRVLTEQAFAHRRLFEQQLVDGPEAFAQAFREVLRRALAADDPVRPLLERWLRDEEGDLGTLEKVVYACVRERGEITPLAGGDHLREPLERAVAQAEAAVTAVAELAAASTELTPGVLRRIPSDVEVFFDTCRAFLEDGDALAFGAAFRKWAEGATPPRLPRLQALLRPVASRPEIAHLVAALEAAERQPSQRFPWLASELAERASRELRARKRSLGLYDFDDMLLDVREGLCGPEADPELGRSLRRQFRCALIDEFQDTDAVQWAIFRSLFFDSTEGHRLFLVGDPKQAIYGFRGADVHTYHAACREIEEAGGVILPLDHSFRATAPLVEASNRLFGDGFFTGEGLGYREVSCGRPALTVAAPPGEEAPVHLVHVVGSDRPPDRATFYANLGEFIAREVERIVVEGALHFGEGSPEAVRYRDIQVLTRTGLEGRRIGKALGARGVPHTFYRQEGLFATDEARDVLELLRALAAPEDPASRLRAWLTPFFGVPLRDLPSSRQLPESHPLVARLAEWHHQASEGRLGTVLRALARDSGLVRRLVVANEGERELANYLHLLDFLVEEVHRSPCTLAELADRLEGLATGRRAVTGQEGDLLPALEDLDAVQILTVHKAKGLEAAVVFIAGGFGPPPRGSWDLRVYYRDGRRHAHLGKPLGRIARAVEREELEEAQRLLYVAVTRAKARVYLPYFGSPRDPSDGYSMDCKGSYLQLARRLEGLAGTTEGLPAELFRYVRLTCDAGDSEAAAEASGSWRPNPELLADAEPDSKRWRQLRRERRGALLTSYTRLHRLGETAGEGEWLADLRVEEAPSPVMLLEEDLPPGRATGIFLHQVLEEADRAAALAAEDEGSWGRQKAVAVFLERLAARHGVEARHLPAARRLAWAGLRTPVSVEGLALPEGLASAQRQLMEMEFLFPIPEAGHPSLGGTDGAPGRPGDDGLGSHDSLPYRARRGFVQGVVDLVFEHQERVFFLDWKSDLLPRWDASSLLDHVQGRYDLQARLYSLAVVRLLGISGPAAYQERFGGLFYCFLRGLEREGPEAGLYYRRPEWDEVVGWEQELRERQRW